MDEAVIEAKNLHKSYGGTQALIGLDLSIQRGEIFALLGPNGAGKTTTIALLTGQLAPDSGSANVLGSNPWNASPHHRAQVGVVAQAGAPFDALQVGEVLDHFATFYPEPRSVTETLELVGLSDKRHARVKTLSGGQQRRLDVALGIIGSPKVLFLDEPTTGFDPEARRAFWDLIHTLKATGTTIVLTTHYLDEVEALADRVGVLLAGELAHLATPAELTARCATQTVVRWHEPSGIKTVTTATPTALVSELSHQFGGEVPGLTISRPSLEDVYLSLVNSTEPELAGSLA